MHPPSLTPDRNDPSSRPSRTTGPAPPAAPPARQARSGNPAALAAALQESRADTLATFALYEQALPGLQIPYHEALNPPLWELGHIGWFQDWWLARFSQRHLGLAADPDAARRAPARAGADSLYNSSLVPHATRWGLPLPDAHATKADLAQQLVQNLDLLAQAEPTDNGLYFYRLALHHEDMHHEAALYMAQALGVPMPDTAWQASVLPEPPTTLQLPAGPWRLGSTVDAGFAFDNECRAHDLKLGTTAIDAQAVRWAEYLPFVQDGGYAQPQWWCEAGTAWRQRQPTAAPRYLRQEGSTWGQWRHGQWRPLDPREPACHLTCFEARAWCRWAGRRLPTEAEWERAAITQPQAMRWGDVWEWTASPFAPYPGFEPHPYRDYSAPWFDGRPVLRGASFMTQPRMKHARYRNYFPAHRNDVPAGFRSCAL
jgi:iron(II)-dependent oxidoreductase